MNARPPPGADPVDPLGTLAARAAGVSVICLGLSALDMIWRTEALLAGGGEKIRSHDYTTCGGGMAANAAVAVRRLGGSAAFWGRGGADAAGELMRQELAGHGIDIAFFRLFEGGASSVSGIVVDATGERQIVNFRGHFPDAADWLPLDTVARAGAVLADPRWPEGAAALFEAARRAGVPTVLDADVAERAVFDRLLPLTDHAIFSETALARYAGAAIEPALAEVVARGCRVAAVTRGAAGAKWLMDGRLRTTPAVAVEAIDTVGAGDVFHGAYAFALGGGLTMPDAMGFAALAAALKCMRPGARAGIPTLDDCLSFLRTLR